MILHHQIDPTTWDQPSPKQHRLTFLDFRSKSTTNERCLPTQLTWTSWLLSTSQIKLLSTSPCPLCPSTAELLLHRYAVARIRPGVKIAVAWLGNFSYKTAPQTTTWKEKRVSRPFVVLLSWVSVPVISKPMIPLFPKDLLPLNGSQDELVFRPLQKDDYDKGILLLR